MKENRQLKIKKSIALVAHDNKKDDIIDWALNNQEFLQQHKLYGTGSTAELISEKLQIPVTKLLSGPLGGDQQIGAMIAEGDIDFMVFFWDPLEAQPHDSDVKAVLRLAVAWNILIANNRTTADFVVTSALMNREYEIKLDDYSKF
jgi:methylglyoxal synthase